MLQTSAKARALLMARAGAGTVSSFSVNEPAFDLKAAYEVGRELDRLLRADGYQRIGRKLGLTNQSIWSELGLTEPIWAPIYDETVFSEESGSLSHSLAGAVAPRLEIEVVFQLASVTPLQFEWIALGYEIVQSHFGNWDFSSADAVADFGLHRALLIGDRVSATPGLVSELTNLEVMLFCNRAEIASGVGSNVLGGPAIAIDWLVTLLESQPEAEKLQAGEIVTTGALTGAHPVSQGQTWTVSLGGGKNVLPTPTLFLED